MITYILSALIIGFFVFELIEHVLFPLVWSFASRKRNSLCGNEGMLGKVAEVKFWQGGEGLVFVDGELWKAVSDGPLKPGDRAVIERVEGLVLMVAGLRSEAGARA
jgi:membrane-bound ClpP family serine protease